MSVPVMRTLEVQASKLTPRLASRVIVLNEKNNVLLLEYCHSSDALSGLGCYYTTPGGRVDPGETFLQCAQRELFEETGIKNPVNPRVLAKRFAPLYVASGKVVLATEQYFFVKTNNCELSRDNFTEIEKEIIKKYKWCSRSEFSKLKTLWPSTLDQIIDHINAKPDSEPLEFKSTSETIGDLIVNVEY